MNYRNSNVPFTRSPPAYSFQQTYAPTPSLPLSQLSQQVSQDYDYKPRYQGYETNEMRMPNENSSLSFKNYSAPGPVPGNMGNGYGQASQNVEQMDIDTILSPVLLKAYNVLRECEYRPEALDKIRDKLVDKLNQLENFQKGFNAKMNSIIAKAEEKYKMIETLTKNKSNSRATRHVSADNHTKKHQNTTQKSEEKPSRSQTKTPGTRRSKRLSKNTMSLLQ